MSRFPLQSLARGSVDQQLFLIAGVGQESDAAQNPMGWGVDALDLRREHVVGLRRSETALTRVEAEVHGALVGEGILLLLLLEHTGDEHAG